MCEKSTIALSHFYMNSKETSDHMNRSLVQLPTPTQLVQNSINTFQIYAVLSFLDIMIPVAWPGLVLLSVTA